LGLALVLNASANLMMKTGMIKVQAAGGLFKSGPVGGIVTILTSPILMTGLICFALNALFYMFALQSKALKISIAYPIMVGGGFAIIALVAYFSLDERLTPLQWAGVLLILLGVGLVAAQMAPEAVRSAGG
jgi:multidrug transporter EmrE-like cation transporter